MKTTKKTVLFTAIALILYAFFALWPKFLPVRAPLTEEGLTVIGIFAASLFLWITVSIDWPSLITILLIGFLPSFGFNKVFQGTFGNSTVVFLLLTFMLVYPLSKTNFIKRCTCFFITNRIARKSPWAFVTFLFSAVTFMGLFISPSVLFVAFMPFLESIFDVLEVKKGSKTANMMMMGSAFAISLSSGMTPIAHVWPTLAMSTYASATKQEIGQFSFMAFAIPTGIVLLVLMILMFRFLYRPTELKHLPVERAEELKKQIPPSDRKERIILFTMAITVLLWVVPSLLKNVFPAFYETVNGWTNAFPPLIGCLLLFFLHDEGKPILSFREVTEKGVLWGAVLMTGAATMLASALTDNVTGIKPFLTEVLSPVAGALPALLMVFFFVVWTVLQTNFSSNIVTTTVVSSVAISLLLPLSESLGSNFTIVIPAVLSLIGFGAAICNMTPAGQSTINTVAIGSGYTTAKDMFLWGGLFAVLAILVLCFVGYPLGALILQ